MYGILKFLELTNKFGRVMGNDKKYVGGTEPRQILKTNPL